MKLTRYTGWEIFIPTCRLLSNCKYVINIITMLIYVIYVDEEICVIIILISINLMELQSSSGKLDRSKFKIEFSEVDNSASWRSYVVKRISDFFS